MDRVLLTAAGAERLREELKRLKAVERPRVIADIAEARAHGDLSENAEYDAAREEQGFIEGRIAQLNGDLSHAEIINPATLQKSGKVVFGCVVTLLDVEKDAEVRYQIVGNLEADISKGQVSLNSPIAKALLGHRLEDEVDVHTPGGLRQYKILEINYDA